MVVKTELCSFSGFKIYPGHGSRFIRLDGKHYTFLNGKSRASLVMRRKAANLNWTQLYRRLHKKGQTEESSKRRTRARRSTVPKAVVGASLEVIRAKREQKPEVRKAAREAALKEIKARSAKKK
uniref:Large ribosomal subunit protein eL24-related N-terminal domain-containing protein n=1 Tax=Timspurckia oligopyrenoides TaxID=708627 RepID=A0A7S0ZEW3_9RHOD|mmetsp:Transcript_2524/g.4449  ORF Transcript_2524/g.4449 Transcript_2524/m.4449 type:complete len:124 (+) Transcript_2524:72-443(+)